MAKKWKALNVKDVAKDLTLLDTVPGGFALLRDSEPFAAMVNTLDLITSNGWRVAGMSTNLSKTMASVEMYVLLQREATTSAETGTWPYEG